MALFCGNSHHACLLEIPKILHHKIDGEGRVLRGDGISDVQD